MTTPQDSPAPTSSPTAGAAVHVVLVPGFWLGAWAWDAVVPHLRAAGLVPHAVTLPGLESVDADRSGLTLDDHVAAVRALVDGLAGDVVLVGHSGGGAVVQHVVDAAPGRVRRVVYVDSGPLRAGTALDPGAQGADHPMPTWDAIEAEGTGVDGLDDATRADVARRAVPHPAGVVASPAHPTDPRRLGVPTTVVCTSIPAATLHELVAAGHVPAELPDHTDVTYVDLPTSHWPMFSRPADLARVLAEAARA